MLNHPPTDFSAAIDRGRRLFDIVAPDIRSETFRRGVMSGFANGEYLIQQGDCANGIHIITGGTVESLYETAPGRNLILATWQEGDFVGAPYLFGDHPHAWSARALGSVEALHLDHDRLQEFIMEFPAFALALIECLGFKGARYSRLAQTLATHTTTERLGLLLSELARNAMPSADGLVRVGAIKQSRLAQMIGATRQAVGIALQRLEDNGYITQEPTSIVIRRQDFCSRSAKETAPAR